jgi:CRISPR-associated endonuclease Cas2
MMTLLLYDITAHATRSHVSARCEDRGLRRMQWSAFWGVMPSSMRRELVAALDAAVSGQAGVIIHAVPLTRDALRKMWVLDQGALYGEEVDDDDV